VAYARGSIGNSSKCLIKRNATTWVGATDATGAERGVMTTSAPGVPPLEFVRNTDTHSACEQQNLASFGVNKRITSRKLHIAGAAWDYNITDIADRERGLNLNTNNGYCNSSNASGLGYASETTTLPQDYELLPGTSAGYRALRTGSRATHGCVSRYGIQDLVGNVEEYASDRTGGCDTTALICPGLQSAIDTSNYDWVDVPFSSHANSGGASDSFNFSVASEIIIPLGIPVISGSPAWMDSFVVGGGVGQFDPNLFYGDQFASRASNSGSKGSISGGHAGTGNQAGRFFLRIDMSTGASATRTNLRGGRCVAPAD